MFPKIINILFLLWLKSIINYLISLKLIINFGGKSLVIPNEDYNIFKNENYYIDDGTTHIFNEDCNGLLILDTNKKPKVAIFFSEVAIENKLQYEICQINITLKKDISSQADVKRAQNEVLSIIEETFILLNDILKKRAKPNKSIRTLGFKYYVLNKGNHLYNVAISLHDRISYLQFIPQLDYEFAISDD